MHLVKFYQLGMMFTLHKNHLGFKRQDEIDVADFILTNYEEYLGDSSFLTCATKRTNNLMKKLNDMLNQYVM